VRRRARFGRGGREGGRAVAFARAARVAGVGPEDGATRR
jgi:hypothetical protein